jgi:hypothetical protein
MAKKGGTDTDMGLENIFKELDQFRNMCIKVGVTEDVGGKVAEEGGPTVAQYASWNELGVKSKSGKKIWRIPPRPFVRGFADGKRELIAKTMEKLGGLVTGGKLDADTAIRMLGEFGMNGVKSYIKHGTFTPNSDITINGLRKKDGSYVLGKDGKPLIKGKKSSKPLIDTKNLVNSIRFQVIEKPVALVSEK